MANQNFELGIFDDDAPSRKLSFCNLRRSLGSVFFETSASNVRIVKLGVNLSFSNI